MTDSVDATSSLADASLPSQTNGRDVFILGAGFSKAVATQMLTMAGRAWCGSERETFGRPKP